MNWLRKWRQRRRAKKHVARLLKDARLVENPPPVRREAPWWERAFDE